LQSSNFVIEIAKLKILPGALMNVEYTGRQFEVTAAIRKEVEAGLVKIRKILKDKFDSKVILSLEKHRHKAEITITPRRGPLVGLAQAKDMKSAINEALEHLEKQALKYKTRKISKKRHARKTYEEKKWNGKGSLEDGQKTGRTTLGTIPLVVHQFSPEDKTPEIHVVHSNDSVALRPMTLEEAVKEAHFRDRDVFVFRDPQGKVLVLHRTRDGKMELIEAP
jgi:ribosome hibernation promoting factor